MKYGMMPRLMWTVFRGSFARELPRLTDAPAGPLMEKSHRRYREILAPSQCHLAKAKICLFKGQVARFAP